MTLSDLPDIQITRNSRSKRLRLRIDGEQIKLTAPVFCSQRQIQQFIQASKSWILKTWQAQQSQIQQIDRTRPSTLQLFNVEQPIQIQYISQRKNFNYAEGVLYISERQPEAYLKAFIIEYAKQHLPEYLKQVSNECTLHYQSCNIRQPRTRWGSCSAKHDIMLNSSIVLFPKDVVRYLCVHELAHTRHFDHSSRFWALVAQHDVNFQQHRHILKNTPMPYWWTGSFQ